VLAFDPDLKPGWMGYWTIIALAAGAGAVLERVIHYLAGRWVDPVLMHWGSRWETKLELDKLKDYVARGVISQDDAKRIADRIAKRDVAGGPRPVRNRPPTYRKRRPSAPSAPGSDAPASP
jgi:hypothetical protein